MLGSSHSPFSAVPDNASFLLDESQHVGAPHAQRPAEVPGSLRAGGPVSSNASVVSSPFTEGSETQGQVGAPHAPSDLDDEFAALVVTGQPSKARSSTRGGQAAASAGGVPANLRGFVDEPESEEEEHPHSLSFGNWG